MKNLLFLTLLTLATTVGCTKYITLFKYPAQLDPIPVKNSSPSANSVEYPKQWNLEKMGLYEESLKNTKKGSKLVKVALLSTGVDYNSSCLQGQIAINEAEITDYSDIKPSVDYKDSPDDEDDLVDNVVGWDVVNSDGLAYDRHGAGTAVAGIIAAKGKGCEVKGIADDVTLYPIRYINDNGQSNVPQLVSALEVASTLKADIIFIQSLDLPVGGMMGNAEAGAVEQKMISAALEKLEKAGVPIVVGAGESNEAFKQTKLGKAFLRSNVFVVTSSNKQDNLGKLANHGERSVITAAPGDKIKVLGLKNSYQEVRGTAYAACWNWSGSPKSTWLLGCAPVFPVGVGTRRPSAR